MKTKLGLDRVELEDQSASEDELDESLSDTGDRPARRKRARKGALGDWEKIGWMAAGLCRRVPGVEFMFVTSKVEGVWQH